MADEIKNDVVDEPVEEPIEEPVEEPKGEGTSSEYPEEIVALAKKMGWRDKGEFDEKGKEFVDPYKYIENLHAISQTTNFTNERLRKDMAEMKRVMQSMNKNFNARLQRELQEERSRLMAERYAAVVEGDIDKFKKIDKAIEGLSSQEIKDDYSAPEAPEFAEWREKNEWFEVDKELTKYANDVAAKLPKTMPLKDVLEFVDAKVELYREKNVSKPQARRKEATMVGGGDKTVASYKARFTASDLDYGARKVMDDMRRQGIVGTAAQVKAGEAIMTEADYIQDLIKNGAEIKK
jgi:hypothetical protein